MDRRQPRVAVLGGGSWGTTVASIVARSAPTDSGPLAGGGGGSRQAGPEQPVPRRHPATTACGRPTRWRGRAGRRRPGHRRSSTASGESSSGSCRDARPWTWPRPGQGAGTGHRRADDRNRRGGAAGEPGRRARGAKDRQGSHGRRRRGRDDRHAGPEPFGPAGRPLPHHRFRIDSTTDVVGAGDRRRVKNVSLSRPGWPTAPGPRQHQGDGDDPGGAEEAPSR